MTTLVHTHRQGSELAPAFAAALVLAIGMGFGRFAFTGLYPLMVNEGVLTVHSGTLAASANYAGYLLGALLVAGLKPQHARSMSIFSMAATVVSTAALYFLHSEWPIIVVRGLAGIFSAFAMVAAALWLLQHMRHHHRAPVLFAGVGIGIALSAELIVLGRHLGMNSAMVWILLAASSLVLAIAALPGLNRGAEAEPEAAPAAGGNAAAVSASPASTRASAAASTASASTPGSSAAPTATLRDAALMIVIYGLAGFGYIVTATYLPLLIKDALGSVDPIHVWAVFGLGAVPSCFFWYYCHVHYGTRTSLIANLLVQAVGVALPAVSHSAVSYLASAFLVGGTFVGTVTIVMPAARHLARAVRFNILAVLTASYGVGQIVGPLVANAMYAGTHSFNGSLLTAAGALVAAAVLSLGI